MLNSTAVQQMLKHSLIFKHVNILNVICSHPSLIHMTLTTPINNPDVNYDHICEQRNRIKVVVIPNFRFCG